ncbi:MAG: hypothetical protein D6820_11005 [Lentisphaerae bacterium]|nr:MAG: hypothetical protein D6820_11005 [Lentisphaerota bacterium]
MLHLMHFPAGSKPTAANLQQLDMIPREKMNRLSEHLRYNYHESFQRQTDICLLPYLPIKMPLTTIGS